MRKHGFTLIELLIVIAIIAILALIAIPNFIEAQTRSKVSRAMADQRSIGTAVEAYCVDWTRYPSYQHPLDITDAGLVAASNWLTYVPITLTTPVAFITALMKDPFRVVATGKDPQRPFFYRHCIIEATAGTNDFGHMVLNGTTEVGQFRKVAIDYFANAKIGVNESDYAGRMWYLCCIGPDLKAQSLERLKGTTGQYAFKYDPTNGTVSDGEVIKWGP